MKDIADTLRDDNQLKTLWSAIEKADIEELIKEKGPYTIFAPTNDAFNKIPSDELNELLANHDELVNTLKNHIVMGKYTSTDVAKMEKTTSMSGEEINVDTSNGVRVNESKVIKPDIEGSNGIIHFVDTPLITKYHK
ncbi:MAG: fasciclin domain-containing protein [Candidatus Natronoplasma sp.]